jgi:hypothetical protein
MRSSISDAVPRRETRGEALDLRSDAELLRSIRQDLTSIYSDVLQQPLPSHIADLIARLAREAES